MKLTESNGQGFRLNGETKVPVSGWMLGLAKTFGTKMENHWEFSWWQLILPAMLILVMGIVVTYS